MEGYIGEIPLPDTREEASYTKDQWAMRFIESYGQIDGAHHKAWVLDQVAQVLLGTPVVATMAQWEGPEGEIKNKEVRFRTGLPSKEYLEWVSDMKGPADEDGETEYEYEEGIAP